MTIDGTAVPVSNATLDAHVDVDRLQNVDVVHGRDADGSLTDQADVRAGGVSARALLEQILGTPATTVTRFAVPKAGSPNDVVLTREEVLDGFPVGGASDPALRFATFDPRYTGGTVLFFRPWRGGDDANGPDQVQAAGADLPVTITTDGARVRVTATSSTLRPQAGAPVTFTATAEQAVAAPRCVWDFRDGTAPTAPGPCEVQHAFARAGSFAPTVALLADHASGAATAGPLAVGATPGGGSATTPATTSATPAGGNGGAGAGGGSAPTGGGTTTTGVASGAQQGAGGQAGSASTPAASAATSSTTTPAAPAPTGVAKQGARRPGGGRASSTASRPTTRTTAATAARGAPSPSPSAAPTPSPTPAARPRTTSTPSAPASATSRRSQPKRRPGARTPSGRRIAGVLAAGPGGELAAALAAADALAAAPAPPVVSRAAAGGGDLHLLGVVGGVGGLIALLGVGAAREGARLRGSVRLRPS